MARRPSSPPTARTLVLAFLVLSASASCAPQGLQVVDCPAVPGSGEPNLATGADGRLYLSWIEPDGDAGHRLRFAVWDNDGWSPARTIARGEDWFVNWADFPSLAALADGTLAAHWLVKSGDAPYAYDVVLSVSRDGGESWSEPVRPHRDGTPTEHGFVSLVPLEDRFAVVWLDGRQMEGGGAMTLRHATLDRDGVVGAGGLIDDRVCDCCQTGAVRLADGSLIAAYRDRSEAEVRDIYVSRLDPTGAGWSAPAAVHDDGWTIGGCPVNGPALAANGERVACAWFTMPGSERGEVRVAFSTDGGRTFGEPVRVDDGDPAGRVTLAQLEDGAVLVGWLERGEPATIRTRRVEPSGTLGPAEIATPTVGARSSGFPRLARFEGRTFLAWTEPGEPSHVRTAVLP